ncbi:hypothetical protein [Blastococcus sp. SYSU DS0619]
MGAIFLSAIAFNLLSDQFEVSAPLVMLLAFIALLLLLVVESQSRSSSAGSPPSRHFLSETSKNLLIFSLSSMILGAIVGAIWVLPIWESQEIDPPLVGGFFHNYELGAALVIAVLGCVAAVRGRPPADWLIFLTAAVTGMTLAIVSLKPVNDFLPTFLGWWAVVALATITVAFFPEVFRLFGAFWGSRSEPGRSLFLSSDDPQRASPIAVTMAERETDGSPKRIDGSGGNHQDLSDPGRP